MEVYQAWGEFHSAVIGWLLPTFSPGFKQEQGHIRNAQSQLLRAMREALLLETTDQQLEQAIRMASNPMEALGLVPKQAPDYRQKRP